MPVEPWAKTNSGASESSIWVPQFTSGEDSDDGENEIASRAAKSQVQAPDAETCDMWLQVKQAEPLN